MKKFTFLLTLLAMVLCNVQSAFADDAKWTDKYIASFREAITSLDNLNNGYYVLRNAGRKTFVKAEGEALMLRPAVQSTTFTDFQNFFQNNADVAYVFYLEKSTTESGKFSIQGKTGKYFPSTSSADHNKDLSLNATKYEYTIKHIDGKAFGLNSGSFYLDGKAPNGNYQNGTVVPWNDASTLPGATENGAYEFYPVTLADKLTATYNYNVGEHTVLTVQKKFVPGATVSADAYPCLTVNNCDKANFPNENCTVVFSCSMDLPFKLSTAEDPKYYAIKMHTGNRMMVADEANSEVACYDVSTSLSEGLPELNQWAFIGTDAFESFKLYNKATKKYLLSSNASDIATLVDEAQASTFKVKATQIQSMTNGFCISNDSYYLNYQDPAGKNKPGVYGWSSNDNGSTCTVFTPESFALNYANNWVNIPKGAISGKVYLETASNLTALKDAYNAVSNNPTESNINTLVNINKAIATSKTSTFKEGYYRLVNRQDNKFLHIKNEKHEGNTIMNAQADKEKAVGSVVYFKSAGEGQYNLMMEGLYFGAITKSAPIVLGNEASRGTYTIEFLTNNPVAKIHESTNSATEDNFHYLHENNGNAVGWEAGEGNVPSHWYVYPATDIEVALNNAGDNSYATAYLPFGVSAVSGAEAYVGTLNAEKTELNMTKTTSVPAKKGFVLVGAADAKATLTIGNATETVNSDLTGTNTAISLTDGNRANYLVFGRKKDVTTNELGFFKTTATTIPANKAFLDATTLTSGASAIAMNFGGNTTGVNTVVLGENGVNAPVFDLSGRRVVAPVKGGVYIQNGKKFIK